MKLLRLTLLLLAALWGGRMLAQDDDEGYRMEIGASAGMVSPLDDLNSSIFGNVGFSGGAMMRFILNPRMAVKAALNYGALSGSANGLKAFYPAHPNAVGEARLNYSYNGGVCDLAVLYELHFLPYGYDGGYMGLRRVTPYLQAGVGLAYGTAGKSVTPSIPVGVGLKYKAGRRLNLGLEWRMHFTPNDKLDGLEAPLGIPASGFRNKDYYSFTLFTLTYDISPKCPNCNKD